MGFLNDKFTVVDIFWRVIVLLNIGITKKLIPLISSVFHN
jgi:hypothetical protein